MFHHEVSLILSLLSTTMKKQLPKVVKEKNNINQPDKITDISLFKLYVNGHF